MADVDNEIDVDTNEQQSGICATNPIKRNTQLLRFDDDVTILILLFFARVNKRASSSFVVTAVR